MSISLERGAARYIFPTRPLAHLDSVEFACMKHPDGILDHFSHFLAHSEILEVMLADSGLEEDVALLARMLHLK